MKRTSTTRTLFLFLAFFAILAPALQAQATLTVQGVLKKSDGTAVDDDTYNITFTLWKSQTSTSLADTAWRGEIPVETRGGVYSAVLGAPPGPPLTAPFDTVYYLGVKVQGSSQELQPRPLLTHAPYAMSLLGDRNKFPSRGIVRVDTISVGSIAYVDSLSVSSVVTTNLNLAPNKTIQYDSLSDWRLVQLDDFDNGANGWKLYSNRLDADTSTSTSVAVRSRTACNFYFTRNVLGLDGNSGDEHAYKKRYDLNNTPHSKIKIVYTVYSCRNIERSYSMVGRDFDDLVYYDYLFDDDITIKDGQLTREIILNTTANTFVLGFYAEYELGPPASEDEERLYIDNIEIWVK